MTADLLEQHSSAYRPVEFVDKRLDSRLVCPGEAALIKFFEAVSAKLQTFTVIWLTIRPWAGSRRGRPVTSRNSWPGLGLR
jgi:hypothetical protein